MFDPGAGVAVALACALDDGCAVSAGDALGFGDGHGVPLVELLGPAVPLPIGVGTALELAHGDDEPVPPLGDSRKPAAVTKMMKMK